MKLFLNLLASGVLPLLLVGCGSKPAATPAKTPTAESSDTEHGHGAGPHGGTIGEWGGGVYHIEFTVDHDQQEATVYVLGGDAKTPSPIKAEKVLLTINQPSFQVDLVAQPLEGDAEGTASRFVGKHESLNKVQKYAGSVTAEVDGTPYAGDFKEEAGDHKPEKR